jgi:hypothetical protein
MSELAKVESNTLEDLAARINAEHRACEAAAASAVEHAIRAGEMLLEVKQSLKHGEWLPWLEANFEGTARTAQVYMQLHSRRGELANTQHASHLSIRSALKELAPPSDSEESDKRAAWERNANSIRHMMEMDGFLESEEERAAFERIAANPGPMEDALLHELTVEEIRFLGAISAVDGFLPSEDAHISYRAPLGKSPLPPEAKEKIVKVPVPATEAMKRDPHLAECIKRGSWQYGLMSLRTWRILSKWWARALAADPETDMDLWEERVSQNADWRQVDPAADFLRERVSHPELDPKQWAKEHDVDPRELREAIGVAKVWIGIRALNLERHLTGDEAA